MMNLLPVWIPALPLAGAALAWGLRKKTKLQNSLMTAVALGHMLLTAALTLHPEAGTRWVGCDGLSLFILQLTSVLFLAVSVHSLVWLPKELRGQESAVHPEGILKTHIFVICMLAFLGTMSMVLLSRNFGLLWVSVEATTLVSAPLILFHRSAASIEAMWKYLLICSVGIGFALFGTMLLAAGAHTGGEGLFFDVIRRHGADPGYFKAAFIFILAGYGTKMGLAPFHTWLPDAHSEAPGTVSALLSGALLNCSWLGILRFFELAPESVRNFCGNTLAVFGVLSLLTAACFILRQSDYKRMLAYSSVEHMGLLALFWAFGAGGIGAVHLAGHSILKVTLFLLAGNFLLGCGTRKAALLGGLLKRLPRNGVLWSLTIVMICGLPPSPLFATEFGLLFRLPVWLCIAVLILLFTVFAGMTSIAVRMLTGPDGEQVPAPEAALDAERCVAIPLILLAVAILFGGAMLTMLGKVL